MSAQSIPVPQLPLPSSLPPPPLDTQDNMRLFSWNINGITPFLQKPITSFFHATKPASAGSIENTIPPASLRGFLYRHGWPAVLFLQEVKISPKDSKTQDVVRRAVNEKLSSENPRGPKYEVHFTLPNDAHNARGSRRSGRIYGVCSIIRSDVCSKYQAKIRTVDWDKEGRVSVVELQHLGIKFVLFNLYAVNGTDNLYRNPSTGAVQGTRSDRKLAFHKLLVEECLRLEQEGWHIILAGDMNVAPDERDGHPRLRTFPHQHVINRADFISKFLGGGKESTGTAFNGVDVWRETHGDVRQYTYYPRGRQWGSSCDRIDYIISGRQSWERGFITGAGILNSEAERGPSDHVPIWVDFNMNDNGQ